MPQSVYGSGCIPLKPGSHEALARLARQFDGWLEWDEFELSEHRLSYAYNDIVTIGTAGDLDDFLEEVAEQHASAGWAHYGEEWDDVCYFGPTEQARLDAEISDLERRTRSNLEALASVSAKRAALVERQPHPRPNSRPSSPGCFFSTSSVNSGSWPSGQGFSSL